MSPERARQGWQPPSIGAARLELVPNEGVVESIVKEAAADSIHLCQGIRSNGLVNRAQRALAGKGLRQWVVMETVEDKGWRDSVKRLAYWRLFRSCRSAIEGVLATGWRTPDWVVARGVAWDRVFPFAYFLPELPNRPEDSRDDVQPTEAFRFLFVGQLIELKRVDLLIKALSVLVREDFELVNQTEQDRVDIISGLGSYTSSRRAVLELAGNKSLRYELIARGRENVKLFLPAVIAAKYISLYRRPADKQQAE